MSIKHRLALLLALLLLGFLATLLILRGFERREIERTAAAERQARSQLLGHWIDAASRSLPQFASDAAQSVEFAQLLGATDPAAAAKKISASLADGGAQSLWIVRADGTVRTAIDASDAPPAALPLEAADFARLIAETPAPRFFAAAGPELLEVCVRRLSPAGDWVVVARRWDARHLRTVAELTDASVTLEAPTALAQPPAGGSHIVLVRPLADWQGHPLRTLRVDYHEAELERVLRADWRQALVLVAFGLLLIAAVGLALQGWVLRPLGQIGASLAAENPTPVQKLAAEKSELGRVAELILTSFAQRDTLRREITERTLAQAALERSEATLRQTLEERARLGRDLHDGVIQSLYAAGMGLAGIRAQLRPDQVEAAARLEQTRAALNETVHDVRNFIIGLEPEVLKLKTFSQAVAALLETMHGIRPFRTAVAIDEELAARLTLAQRVHALQITRESVSNALRHGQANNITVVLRSTDQFAEFEIGDDGRGFESEDTGGQGQGLRNLAQRARELSAELSLDSKPGRGTRVRLTFSFFTL